MFCGLLAGRAPDRYRQLGSDGQGLGGRKRPGTSFPRGHVAQIMSVAFSADGQRVVTGSWDQTAKVWDANSGREVPDPQGQVLRLCVWPFHPTASGLLPAVGIRRPRRGKQHTLSRSPPGRRKKMRRSSFWPPCGGANHRGGAAPQGARQGRRCHKAVAHPGTDPLGARPERS